MLCIGNFSYENKYSVRRKKNLQCKCQLPLFRFQPKACCTPSSLYRV